MYKIALVFLTILHLVLSLSCYKCDKESCNKKNNWMRVEACGESLENVLIDPTKIITNPDPVTGIRDVQNNFLNNHLKKGACVSAHYSDHSGKTYTVRNCIMVNVTDPNVDKNCATYLNQPAQGQTNPLYSNVQKCHICHDDLCNSAHLGRIPYGLPMAFLVFICLFN